MLSPFCKGYGNLSDLTTDAPGELAVWPECGGTGVVVPGRDGTSWRGPVKRALPPALA